MPEVIAVPETPEQMEELLNDPGRYKEFISKPENFKEFTKRYATAFLKQDKGESEGQMRVMMAEELKKFYDESETLMTPEAKRALKRLPMSSGNVAGNYTDISDVYKGLGMTRHQQRQIAATGSGVGMDSFGEFEGFRDFARAISPHVTLKGMDARLKVLGEGQGDQGGFLVQEEFRAELLMVALEEAIIRSRARVLPMAGLTVAIPSIRSTSHASNVFGGVTAYWTPESGAITQTEPSFAQARLTAKKLLGGTRLSNELLRDSVITLESLINQLFGSALAYFEDDAFITGIGGGQPVGILNADALVTVAKETGQAATTVLTENVIKMFARMLPSSIARSVWIMNPDVQTQLYTMSLSVGTGGAPMFFPAGGITGSPTPTLLGRPILFSEKAETLGTSGDMYLVDLSYYLIGDRQALEMSSSPHVRFNNDETDFRFIQRVDGRPWIDSALTPRNGSNTLSPFLALATRA